MERFACLVLVSLVAGCTSVDVRPHREGDTPTDPEPDPVVDPNPDPDPDPDPEPDPGPAAFCASSTFPGEAGDVVLATWDDHAVRLMTHDGIVIEHPFFAEEPPADALKFVTAESGAGLVVVAARWAPEDDIFDRKAHVVWYDRKGAAVASMDADVELAPVLVTPDGATVLIRDQLSDADYLVRRADGSTTSFTGFDPYGTALGGGWLRGFANGEEGFFNYETQELRAIDNPGPGSARHFQDGYAYLLGEPSSPVFVRETLDGTTSLPLVGIAPTGGPLWLSITAPGHALLEDGSNGALWRADLASGSTVSADGALPAGLEELDDSCQLGHRGMASDGLVTTAVRDGGAARLLLHDPALRSFSPVGLPVIAPGTFDVIEAAGTFIVHAGDGSDSFCPIVDWKGPVPEGSIDQDTTQIVRPTTGSTHVLEDTYPWALSPSADGTCVAVPGPEGLGWSLLDVVGGDSVIVEERDAAFLWVK